MSKASRRRGPGSRDERRATIAAKHAAPLRVTIYGLVEIGTTEVRYVGRTTKTPQERLTRHIWKARERGESSTLYVSRWIRSCGYAVDVVVLEDDPLDPRQAERDWIERLRAQGARLTNLTHGGEGAPARGFLLSAEQRAKISAANHRRFADPAARKRIGDATRGREVTAETRAKISAAHLGSRHTDEARAKMSAARLGVPKSATARANMSAAQQRRKLTTGQLRLGEGGG